MKKNYFALMGLLLSFSLTVSGTTPELIFDAGFETFTVGEITENTVSFATPKDYKMFQYTPADQGSTVKKEIIDLGSNLPNVGWQCLKVTVSGTLSANYNALIINYSDGILLETGKSYLVKYWVKTSAAIQASTIRIANSDGAGNDATGFKYWHAGAAVSAPLDSWREISFIYTVAASGAPGYLEPKLATGVSIQPIITPAQLTAAGGSISIYLDNFSITENTSTATSNTSILSQDMYLSNRTLNVSNSKNNNYQIFNLAGIAVEKGLITEDQFSKTLNLQAGIYLVKVGNKIAKISLK